MSSEEIPFLDTEELEQRASGFREQFNVKDKVCPIEKIVDVELGIDIVPIPGLHNRIQTSGALSIDQSTIWIDEYCSVNFDEKYRFTLAHEIAHRELHSEFYRTLEAQSVTEYTEVITEHLTDTEYQSMEWQADYFAGAVLVPEKHLETDFEAHFNKIHSHLKEANYREKTGQVVFQIALRELCDEIAPEYIVSPVTVDTRLSYTGMKDEIARMLFGDDHRIETDIRYGDG